MEPHYDVVCIMLTTKFCEWKEEDKQWTIKKGRPTPLFEIKQVSIESTDEVSNFQLSWYKLFPWLCGSSYLKKFFCWPCLLNGIESFNCVDIGGETEELLNKHEGSLWHLKSALKLVELSKKLKGCNIYKNCSSINIVEHNKNALLNRRLMQLLIKAILFFTKLQLPINGCGQNKIASINGNFKELLNLFISESPLELKQQYANVKNYFKSESLQNDLICCLCSHIIDFVKKEVSESHFYSIQLDRISQSHCSLVVRYVTFNGLVVERPLGFLRVNKSCSPEEFFQRLETILYPLNYQNKLVAQCYDGASIRKENLNQLQNKVKSKAHQALFVQSCNHEIDKIIVQCVSDIPECQVFFTNLYSIPFFFNSSTKRLKTLNSTLINRGSKIVIGKGQLSKNYEIVSAVYKEFLAFKNIFKNILSDPSFDDASIRQANTYLKCFKDVEYIFLLSVFNFIFGVMKIKDLFSILQVQFLDINSLKILNEIQVTLTKLRTSVPFDSLFNYSKAMAEIVIVGHEDYYNRDDVCEKFKQLYFKILDSIAHELDIRFKDFKNLQFIQSLFAQWANFSNDLPNSFIQPLIDIYPNVMTDFDRLRNELHFFYSKMPNKQHSIQEIVKKMNEDRSCNIFKEVYKLFSLIITLPYIDVSTNSNIQSYLKTCIHNEKLQKNFQTSLTMLSIGQEVIDHLTNTSMFYDDIIDLFVSLKGQAIPLILQR